MLDGHFRKTITAGNFFVGFSRQQSIQHILFALGQPIAWDKIIGAFLQAEICWDKNLALSHQGHGAIERLDANVLGNITHGTGFQNKVHFRFASRNPHHGHRDFFLGGVYNPRQSAQPFDVGHASIQHHQFTERQND